MEAAREETVSVELVRSDPRTELIEQCIRLDAEFRDLTKHDRSVEHDPKVWGYFKDKRDRDNDGNSKEYTSRFPCDRGRSYGPRPWSRVTAVMLHTTAEEMGWRRFVGLPAQLGVSHDDCALLLFPLQDLVYHGHSLASRFSVGLEISGESACTEKQVGIARALVRYAVHEILNNGGGVNGRVAIMAHRQSHRSRGNDPGRQIWRDVGEWAITELGCTLGPVVGTGRSVDEWRPQ